MIVGIEILHVSRKGSEGRSVGRCGVLRGAFDLEEGGGQVGGMAGPLRWCGRHFGGIMSHKGCYGT